jgi:hypothetical protein
MEKLMDKAIDKLFVLLRKNKPASQQFDHELYHTPSTTLGNNQHNASPLVRGGDGLR